MNSGKIFEEDFRLSCDHDKLVWDRFYDTQGGFSGVATICDFIVYRRPNIFYFELKSYDRSSIPIQAVRPAQLKGLLRKDQYDGVFAGVICEYRLVSRTVCVPIQAVEDRRLGERKTLSLDWALRYGIEVAATKKITRSQYKIRKLLDDLDQGGFINGNQNGENDSRGKN